ncbi:MAG: RluA family pseudouridine synthase [Clostridiaceae bacterium]|uniref:Pseudouridine synthase n=1 Tax=Hominiventricola aquisgranensis TaxID=3133164 RepID=A0ABV1HYX8_9FIRM|nr:RluA family pseudouridine synthase [Clostridiaceae bacterium]MDD5797495.1 RluA family pseudouridine synthase [Clostridiaceae bacterium]MDY4545994.1 RluA family pseudouridine synthase [Candidatus Choladocola sp.]
MSQISLQADETYMDERLDKFLSAMLPDQSRSYLQKIIKDGNVLVNGEPKKSSYRLEDGDEVTADLPELKSPDIEPENIPLDILYEDDSILMVNKPKGMVVHPSAGHYTGTLVNAVLWHCQGQLSGINGVSRPGIVHRIDKDTTGVLVVCKNDAAHNAVAAQLKEHSITRKYRAIVHGVIKEDEGTVDAPIGRHPTERKKMASGVKNGKRAVTHYRVLERFQGYTYVECQLETGRTHQIRVHMASIHHPLLGDTVYGPAKDSHHLEGQTLHAMVLGLIHPVTGEYLEVEAPLPEYFENLLKKFRAMSGN